MDRNGSNMILALADYLDDSHLSQLPLLATRVLTNVCQFAAKQGSQSLLACLGDRVQRLSDIIIFLVEHRRSSVELRVALLEFVEQAVSTQVGLTRLLLGVKNTLKADATAKPSMLDAIVNQELKDGRLTERLRADPNLTLAVLRVIRQLWTVKASQLRRRMEQWEGFEFWKELSRPLIEFDRPVAPRSYDRDELTRWVQQTKTMAFILDVCGTKAFEVDGNPEEKRKLSALGLINESSFVDNLCVAKWMSAGEYHNGTEAEAQLEMVMAWCQFVSICTSRLLPPSVSRCVWMMIPSPPPTLPPPSLRPGHIYPSPPKHTLRVSSFLYQASTQTRTCLAKNAYSHSHPDLNAGCARAWSHTCTCALMHKFRPNPQTRAWMYSCPAFASTPLGLCCCCPSGSTSTSRVGPLSCLPHGRQMLPQVAQLLEAHAGFLANHLSQKHQDINMSMVVAEELYDASAEYAKVSFVPGGNEERGARWKRRRCCILLIACTKFVCVLNSMTSSYSAH